jgi:amino acid permease
MLVLVLVLLVVLVLVQVLVLLPLASEMLKVAVASLAISATGKSVGMTILLAATLMVYGLIQNYSMLVADTLMVYRQTTTCVRNASSQVQ